MYADNDILFPYQAIPHLKALRGPVWQRLVHEILQLPETHERTLAFMLMMIRLNGCLSCETDSYRAMRGCAACAQQSLRRYKGSDDDLIKLFDKALQEIRQFATDNPRLDTTFNITSDSSNNTSPDASEKAQPPAPLDLPSVDVMP